MKIVGWNDRECSGTNGITVNVGAIDWEGRFVIPDGTTLTEDNPITITSTYYSYNPTTLTNNSTGDTVGLSTDSEAYKMLFENEANFSVGYYWLSSSYVDAAANAESFGLYVVGRDKVNSFDLWESFGGSYQSDPFGVVVVVSIDSNVALTSNGINSWTLSD